MKRLYNLILACLLMVSLSACGKQAGADSSADKGMEQHGQTESAEKEQPAESEIAQSEAQTENNLTGGQEQQAQGGDNAVTGDISFNFEAKTVLLNSGYEMPIYGIGTYSLTGDTCVEPVLSGKRCNPVHSQSWNCGAGLVSAWRQGIYGRATRK